jgi:tripartite-type tricarboxylate transporter receptor subunit TctC
MLMDRVFFVLVASILATSAVAEPLSFRGKTITMIVGFASGGGTDLAARLIASVLGKYLPGEPSVVVQNVPGAEGLTALNYFVQQVKPDGLTLVMGSGSEAEPTHYRKPQSRFDPTKFAFVGGAGRGGSALVIKRQVESRLYRNDAPPVIMGSTSSSFRSNMHMAAWGRELLGWNLRWVAGYRGTSELFIALERGEIEMTATSNIAPIAKILTDGNFKILVQSGALRDGKIAARAEFGNAPLMPVLVSGRIKDPVAAEGFDYWMTIHTGPDKWLALPPATPELVVHGYREAFRHAIDDPEFHERSRKLTDDFTPVFHEDVAAWMKKMAATPQAALEFVSAMIGRQGMKSDP